MPPSHPLELKWTELALEQLASIADYISISSPVYAGQIVDRVVRRLNQARRFPESGRVVPELDRLRQATAATR